MTDKLTQDLNSLRIERNKRAGEKRGRKWMVLGIIALVTLAVAAMIAFIPAGANLRNLGGKVREVGVALVARQAPSSDNVVLTAGGYIIPHRRIKVSSKISGRVERLLVEKGELVKANDATQPIRMEMPYTVGKWGETQPVTIALTKGRNVLAFTRTVPEDCLKEGYRFAGPEFGGISIQSFLLKPAKPNP